MNHRVARRLWALVRKECIQVMRDPSALLIAFVLPLVLLFLFAFAVSLDVDEVAFAVVVESEGPAAQDLVAAYQRNDWLDVRIAQDRREVDEAMESGDIRGYVVIPADFEQRLRYHTSDSALQIITDGSQPSTAAAAASYASGIYQHWLSSGLAIPGELYRTDTPASTESIIEIEQRFWFNPELDSRQVLLPGAIAIIMTMIGTLLTALVVAREWERGTMEALMSTPASGVEILLAKIVPYYLLGLVATLICTGICLTLFGLPLRGSWLALLTLSATFLLPALGQGLLISTLAKSQFIASQIALLTAFLPAFLLSGFLFEIASMPAPIRAITGIVSARWYVEGLQTVFLAGDRWPLLLKDMGILALIGTVFIGLSIRHSSGTLDH
ncbi:MAG: ABC transporter permease [Granulosicoccus sp.]|nr:ABC transporter permease [Granulosicoccus sp.]